MAIFKDRLACTHIHGFNNEPICMYIMCVHIHNYIASNPLLCGEISRGVVCWDELAETCGEIFGVAGF